VPPRHAPGTQLTKPEYPAKSASLFVTSTSPKLAACATGKPRQSRPNQQRNPATEPCGSDGIKTLLPLFLPLLLDTIAPLPRYVNFTATTKPFSANINN
jgi:hypothetical protein